MAAVTVDWQSVLLSGYFASLSLQYRQRINTSRGDIWEHKRADCHN